MPNSDTERYRDKDLDVQDPVPGFSAFRSDEIWHFSPSQPLDRWHEAVM
jgi:hypothetical protein